MSAVSAVDGIEFLVIGHVSQAKNIPMGVVRVTADGNMHPIDLVSALCKRNRDKSAETLRNLVKSGRLSKSEFVVRVTNDGNMHPIDLVRCCYRTN